MFLSLDIWHEIISYLDYPNDKRTLRSLAVTSRCLSDLALDVIWHDGETIRSIVSVINFFSPPENPFLHYSNSEGRWVGFPQLTPVI